MSSFQAAIRPTQCLVFSRDTELSRPTSRLILFDFVDFVVQLLYSRYELMSTCPNVRQ